MVRNIGHYPWTWLAVIELFKSGTYPEFWQMLEEVAYRRVSEHIEGKGVVVEGVSRWA